MSHTRVENQCLSVYANADGGMPNANIADRNKCFESRGVIVVCSELQNTLCNTDLHSCSARCCRWRWHWYWHWHLHLHLHWLSVDKCALFVLVMCLAKLDDLTQRHQSLRQRFAEGLGRNAEQLAAAVAQAMWVRVILDFSPSQCGHCGVSHSINVHLQIYC